MTRSASAIGKQNRRKGNEWANEVARRLSVTLGRSFRRSLAEAQTGRRNDIREDDVEGYALPLRVEARAGVPSVKKAVLDAQAMREGNPGLLAFAALHYDAPRDKPGTESLDVLAFPMEDGLILLSLAAILLEDRETFPREEDLLLYVARCREIISWRGSKSSTENNAEKISRRP